MCRFDETWRVWIVAESLADLTNGDLEDGVADKGARPDGVEKCLLCDELALMREEMVEHCEGLGSELYCLRASKQALLGQIQAKGIEHYSFFVLHVVTERYRSLTAGL